MEPPVDYGEVPLALVDELCEFVPTAAELNELSSLRREPCDLVPDVITEVAGIEFCKVAVADRADIVCDDALDRSQALDKRRSFFLCCCQITLCLCQGCLP